MANQSERCLDENTPLLPPKEAPVEDDWKPQVGFWWIETGL